MNETKVYSIGEASIISGLSRKTLRYYDSVGILTPAGRNPENNYRTYTREQVVTLCVINRLRKMNCSLNEMREAIREDSIDNLLAQIETRMDKLEEEIRDRQAIIDENRDFVQRLREASLIARVRKERPEEYSEYLLANMRMEYIQVSQVFSLRKVVKDYCVNDTSIDFWQEMLTECETAGYSTAGETIAIYHCNLLEQFIPGDRDLELCVTVDQAKDDARIRRIGGFQAATAIYMGTYDQIIDTYLQLLQWVNNNGYKAFGEAMEQYLVSPTESFTQENQIVKIVIPVEKK